MKNRISLVIIPLFAIMILLGACAGRTAPSAENPLNPAAVSTPDPWSQAIADAQAELEGANLDAHFAYYQETAGKIDAYLGQLEKVRPALKAIDTLKETDIPVLGNAWQLLVRALDKAYLGAGVALEQVDERLGDLLETHERLQQLDQLNATQTAVEQFQADPTQQTLQAMGEEMAKADFILTGVDKDAASLQDKVDGLLDAVGKTQSGLALIGGVAPPLQDVVKQVQQFIDGIANPLQELSDTLGTLRKQIAEDRDTFWRIRNIIDKTENQPQSFLHLTDLLPT